jgi:hypothetical protein
VQAYLPLEEPQQRDFEHLLTSVPYKEILPMTTTWYEQGVEKGRRSYVKFLLEDRFGPLGPHALEKLQSWPDERLEDLGRALLRGQPSLKDLGLED